MVTLVRSDIPFRDSEEWNADWNKHFDACFKWFDEIQQHHQMKSIWSLFEIRDFNNIPFPDATQLVYSDHWGKPVGVQLRENSTWLDLWIAADYLIDQSGDVHHRFIERFKQHDNGVLSLTTGS